MDVLEKGWGWLLALGVLLSALGLLLIAAPALGTLAIDLLVGWFLIIGGIAQLIHAFMEKAWRGFLLELASGALYLVVGLLLVFYPLAGAQALTIFLAAFLLVEGIVRIAMALRLRPGAGLGLAAVRRHRDGDPGAADLDAVARLGALGARAAGRHQPLVHRLEPDHDGDRHAGARRPGGHGHALSAWVAGPAGRRGGRGGSILEV